MLKYAPFAAVQGLELAAKGGKPIAKHQNGPAVAVLQGSLLALGAKMPKTSAKSSGPDGIFGEETLNAIKNFQSKHGLKVDGLAGKHTLAALDSAMLTHAAKHAVPIPSAPAMRPPPRNPDYQLGHADPPLTRDPGAGAWGSRPKSPVYCALKYQIINVLPHAAVVIGVDAAKHMARYFSNTGQAFRIDMEGMLREVESAQLNLEAEVVQAQAFAETLPPGKHTITSRGAEGGYNDRDESWNWYYAIGGYVSWGKGDLVVQVVNGAREYQLDFEYKMYDRYNWDKGKAVTIFGITITDQFMGEFQRQGLAREFDCTGSLKRHLTWKHGQPIASSQLRQSGGRA